MSDCIYNVRYIGKIVKIYHKNIFGTVIGLCMSDSMRNPTIIYKVVFWDGTSRKEEWLYDFEISTPITLIKKRL